MVWVIKHNSQVFKIQYPGIQGKDILLKLGYTYEWNKLNVALAYSELGSGFNPQVGFY